MTCAQQKHDHGVQESTDLSILCVDDNKQMAEALRIKLQEAGFQWRGWLETADDLVTTAERESPDVVILDVDMPGLDPFEALEKLVERLPDCRTIMFSGHVLFDLVERAFAIGAWGYVSKGDGEDALLESIRAVSDGDIVMSPEVRTVYKGN